MKSPTPLSTSHSLSRNKLPKKYSSSGRTGGSMRQVVLISGRICTGKSGLGWRLKDEFGYHLIRTSEILKLEAQRRGRDSDRLSLQPLGDEMDAETSHRWV